MSREAPSLPAALDGMGMSVATTTRSFAQPNQGTVWRADVLAAGVPVYFHQTPEGRWLMLLTRRWTGGVVDAEPTGPQDYSDWEESTAPCWVPIQTQGNFGNTSGAVSLVPSNHVGTRTLTGATGRGDFMYLLSTLTDGDQTHGLIQDFHSKGFGTVSLINEEAVPGPDGVIFDRGCAILGGHLVLIGRDAARHLHLARKPWSRIGVSGVPWEYWSDRGWNTDPTTVTLTDAAGSPLVSWGPVSLVWYRQTMILALVSKTGDDYSGRLYTSQEVARWTPLGEPVALGSTGYLDGTLFLQPQLGTVLSAEPANASASVPYVASVEVSGDGQSRIDTFWGLASVLRRT